MLDENKLTERIGEGRGEDAAELVVQALAAGVAVPQVSKGLVRAVTPHLDLCAALPFPTRTLDVVLAAVRSASRLSPRLRALTLGRAACAVARAPHPRRQLPEPMSPGLPPEDLPAALAGAIQRADLPLSRALLRRVLSDGAWQPALGRALVEGCAGDAFQGGEKLLVGIAAWLLGKSQPEAAAGDLVDRVLPYLTSEPRDPTPRKVFEALEAGRPVPPLEPDGLDPQWLLGLGRGLMASQLKVSLPRLLHRRVLRSFLGRVDLPAAAPPEHVAYAQALVSRSAQNLPDSLRPLHEALRRGDRGDALPMAVEVLGDGRGYGRVLRIAALVGAERMLVRRYQWGFGMAQDLRLCHGAAALADGLGVKASIPAVLLTTWMVGRGGASVGASAEDALEQGEAGSRDRAAWLDLLEEAVDGGDLPAAREALGAMMGGTTPISQVNRALLSLAATRADDDALTLSYTQACVEVAEHMPRLDAELVLAAAMCPLLLGDRRVDEPWLVELVDRHLAGR